MDNLLIQSLHPKVHIVDTDINGVVALHKACDVMSIPNQDNERQPRSLLYAPYDGKQRCYFLPNGQKFFLLNRLDAPTSGLLIGCFDEKIAMIIRKCFRDQTVQKTYYALTHYKKIPPTGLFHDFLEEHSAHHQLRVTRGQSDKAITKYRIEQEKKIGDIRILRLCLNPITGRTHQLRVQCALRGIPIIGDKTYGDFAFNKKVWMALPQKRLYLQSCCIKFQYILLGTAYEFSSEIPCEF